MSKQKKSKDLGNASQWEGYSEEEKRQADMEYGGKRPYLRRDNSFFHNIKEQRLF